MISEDLIHKLEVLNWELTSVEAVRTLLLEIGEMPATRAILGKGSVILRTRKGWNYRKATDLSFPDCVLCNNIQRATLPGETAFYGSISDDLQHGENARAIGVAECSDLGRAGKESIGIEKLTCGQWMTTRPLTVLSFITDETFPNVQNRWISLLRNQFIENKTNLNDLQLRFMRVVNHFFMETVHENEEYKYKLTASLVHDVFYSMLNPDGRIGFDAVLYPSVAMGGQAGVNIVIRPDVAYKALHLKYIIEEVFYKNKERSMLIIDAGYDEFGNKINGHQCSDDEICRRLDIKSLDMLRE